MPAPRPPATPSASSAPSRRTALGLAGAGSAAVLSACAGADDPSTSGSTGTPARVDAGPVEDVPVGSAVKVDRDGVQAVVGRPDPETVVAFSPVCPHQGCMVTPRDELYVCPCHASQFHLGTGEVLAGPAEAGLEPLPASVEDGRILLG